MLPSGHSGIHNYNDQHRPVLTAMAAVEHIANNIEPQDSIWALSAEHESRETKTDGDLVDAGAIDRRAAPARPLTDSATRQTRSVTDAGDWR
jgi:hypothetical protein